MMDVFFEDPWRALEEFRRRERERFRASREVPLRELGISVTPTDGRLMLALEVFERILRLIEDERDWIREQGLPPGLVTEYFLSMVSRRQRLEDLPSIRLIPLRAEMMGWRGN